MKHRTIIIIRTLLGLFFIATILLYLITFFKYPTEAILSIIASVYILFEVIPDFLDFYDDDTKPNKNDILDVTK